MGESVEAVRYVAEADGEERIVTADFRCDHGDLVKRRGIGPSVGPERVAESRRAAFIALAYAAEGGDNDPGPRCVHADDLGVLLIIADSLINRQRACSDVEAIDRASHKGPWVLRTLEALSNHSSVRHAATALFVHHSTLQSRVSQLEEELPWSISSPEGRHRLYYAMYARRFSMHPPPGSSSIDCHLYAKAICER